MSEVWLDFRGNLDKRKYYDIMLGDDGSIQRRCYFKTGRMGEDQGFENENGWWNFLLVESFRESDDQGEEDEQSVEQQFNISVKSTALAYALTHSKGNLDSMIEGILVTVMGDYEDAGHAVDWNQRKDIYARNAFRKILKGRLTKWFKEGDIQ